MVAAYIFWAFRTGYFGFHLSLAAGLRPDAGLHGGVRRADRAGHLSPTPEHGAARQAGRVARPAARPGGGRDRDLRQQPEVGAVGPAVDTVTIFDRVVPVDRFMLAGIVVVVAAALAALYRWTPFGLSTRASSENEVSAMLVGLSPSRLAVMNTMSRERRRRRARGAGRAADRARCADARLPGRARSRRGPARRLHLLLHCVLRRSRDRGLPVAPHLLGDAELVPDRLGRRAAPRPLGAVRLPRHRGRAVPARGEPARPRRDRREAAAGRAPAGAAAAAGGGRRDPRRRRADRVPVRLPAGPDQLAARHRHLPLACRDHRLRRPDLGRPARARRGRGLHDVAPDDRRRRASGRSSRSRC